MAVVFGSYSGGICFESVQTSRVSQPLGVLGCYNKYQYNGPKEPWILEKVALMPAHCMSGGLKMINYLPVREAN